MESFDHDMVNTQREVANESDGGGAVAVVAVGLGPSKKKMSQMTKLSYFDYNNKKMKIKNKV